MDFFRCIIIAITCLRTEAFLQNDLRYTTAIKYYHNYSAVIAFVATIPDYRATFRTLSITKRLYFCYSTTDVTPNTQADLFALVIERDCPCSKGPDAFYYQPFGHIHWRIISLSSVIKNRVLHIVAFIFYIRTCSKDIVYLVTN